MASAFTVFPNLGLQAKPYFIRRVEDYDRVPKEENAPQTREVLKPEIAAQMLELLQDVVRYGTAKSAGTLRWPLGGKTGTTNDFTDAWFIGFTPSITAAVWVGFDEKKSLGERESGAVAALPIWIDCMREILKDRPMERFPIAEPAGQTVPEFPETLPQGSKPLFIEDLPVEDPKGKPEAANDASGQR
jgi:penicillin-binding protein 1A